jgi:TrmH family RNA methyltransferase
MSVENIRVVLVRPQGAANVGAAARALKNMGLRDLVLVAPARQRDFWATAMAVHAGDVLDRLRSVDTLAAAVADCTLVVGTTCRNGPYRTPAESPRAVAARMVAAAQGGAVALVFGPEDHGLSNADLRACQQLICIPTAPAYPSLNLAQAVMVCCYEIFQAHSRNAADARPLDTVAAPLAGKLELMFERLQAAFLSIGFLHPDNPEHIMYALRRLLGRTRMEEREVQILLGLARQIEWFGRGGWRVMDSRASRNEGPQAGRAVSV